MESLGKSEAPALGSGVHKAELFISNFGHVCSTTVCIYIIYIQQKIRKNKHGLFNITAGAQTQGAEL